MIEDPEAQVPFELEWIQPYSNCCTVPFPLGSVTAAEAFSGSPRKLWGPPRDWYSVQMAPPPTAGVPSTGLRSEPPANDWVHSVAVQL